MTNRQILTGIVGLTFCAAAHPSYASNESEQRARAAAEFYIDLSYQCETWLGTSAREEARADSVLTLEAAGYTPDDAQRVTRDIVDQVTAKPVVPGAADDKCHALRKSIVDGRPAFREQLKTE